MARTPSDAPLNDDGITDWEAAHLPGTGTPSVTPDVRGTENLGAPSVDVDDLLRGKPVPGRAGYVAFGNVQVDAGIVAEWKAAQQYLARDPEAVAALEALEKGPAVVTVSAATRFGGDAYTPSTREIEWDPTAAALYANGTRANPAITLVNLESHALEHTQHEDRWQANSSEVNLSYTTAEEQRAIEGLETRVARATNQGTREDARAVMYETHDSTSIEPVYDVETDMMEVEERIHDSILGAYTHGQWPASGINEAPGSIEAWDGKPHVGYIVHVDGSTVAQAIGDGKYQVYDIKADLKGLTPPEGVQGIEIDAKGQVRELTGPELAKATRGQPHDWPAPAPPRDRNEFSEDDLEAILGAKQQPLTTPDVKGGDAHAPSTAKIDDLLKRDPTVKDHDAAPAAGSGLSDYSKMKFVHYGNLRVEAGLAKEFERAERYLAKDPEARAVLERLEKSPQQITIIRTASGSYASAGAGEIGWNPSVAMIMTNGTIGSPAMDLVHEGEHTLGSLTDPDRFSQNSGTHNQRFNDAEEQRVITGIETRVATHLGEGTRTDHSGSGFKVSDPTSRVSTDRVITQPNELRDRILSERVNLAMYGYTVPAAADPAAEAVRPWDHHEHTGSVLHLNGNTVAQYVGGGHYQIYDVRNDLHGKIPPENVPNLTIDAHGQFQAPQQIGLAQTTPAPGANAPGANPNEAAGSHGR